MLSSPWCVLILVTALGLLLGRALSALSYALPRWLQRHWQTQCQDYLHACSTQAPGSALPAASNTTAPPPAPWHHALSDCAQCQRRIAWSAQLGLRRGRCPNCHAPIAWRAPGLELASVGMVGLCVLHSGWSWTTLAWCLWGATLLSLAWIDAATTYLPDVLVLPLLWLGLLASSVGLIGLPLHDSVWGAAVGYSVLWLVNALYAAFAGQPGMGHGDFKLLAAIGAWLGWQALFPVLLIASLVGAIVGLWLRARHRLHAGRYLPFGPFLALAAGLVAWSPLPPQLAVWI